MRSFQNRNILIAGDAIADRFLYGTINRVSREAPVFILKHEHTETVPGGAANCAMNLASLGAKVSLASVAGDDEAGIELRTKLKAAGVDVAGVQVLPKFETTTKVRILAGQPHSNRQQVIRIDYEGERLADGTVSQTLRNYLGTAVSRADALILSDYNYGVVDDGILELVRERISERRIPVMVDSRFQLSKFRNFTSATPNEDELEHLAGEPITSTEQLENAARKLKQQLGFEGLLVTRGGLGMMLLENDAEPLHINAVGAQQPVDVTGAGDTVIATFTLALASGASFTEAAHLANYAGGLVVMKRGTASITAAELEHSILKSENE